MLIWPFEFFLHPLSNNEKVINAVEAHLVDSLMNLSKRPTNAMETKTKRKKKKNEFIDTLCVFYITEESHDRNQGHKEDIINTFPCWYQKLIYMKCWQIISTDQELFFVLLMIILRFSMK